MTYEQKEKTENKTEERSFFGIIVHSFFIIPFLIAVFCVLLFTAIHLLTRENRSVYDYLEDVKTGGLNKRWQGAFELSKILANPQLVPDDERFINELVAAYKESSHDDPRVRQYLALAMGRTGNKDFVAPLLSSLENEKQENLLAVIYALGMLKDTQSVDAITAFADDSNARVRSVAITALGSIGDKKSIPVFKKALDDSEANVQWGAAVSLAMMNDYSGKETLGKLLDRNYLSQFPEVDPQEQNQLMLMTLDAVEGTKDEEIRKAVKALSESDSNMKIRSAALGVLTK